MITKAVNKSKTIGVGRDSVTADQRAVVMQPTESLVPEVIDIVIKSISWGADTQVLNLILYTAQGLEYTAASNSDSLSSMWIQFKELSGSEK